ncbi:MAG: hypothetical protein JSV91_14115, partial [Phycisphaerales bacterium]
GNLGTVVTNPSNAPDSYYVIPEIGEIAVLFADNFETDQGWAVENSDYLTNGSWERGTPQGGGVRGDPPTDADGSGQCYVTGNGLEGQDHDVDGGTTTLISPVMDATEADAEISYYRWYNNSFGINPHEDIFYVDVSDDGGSSWVNLETLGPDGPYVDGGWFHKAFLIADIAGISNTAQFRIRFIASDEGSPSVVEAGVDGVELEASYCEDPECPQDVNQDGLVDIDDLFDVLAHWAEGPGAYDINNDGVVDIDDVFEVLANWGPCP